LDRLCTEVIGLDGRGGAAIYASLGQWLTAHESSSAAAVRAAVKVAPQGSRQTPTPPRPRKFTFREKQEWEQMEATILAAEEVVNECQAEVERAAAAGHAALADACRALEEAQRTVERLYSRWQELEARGGA
jgi:ATP-binding cassette subfamily F protein uup